MQNYKTFSEIKSSLTVIDWNLTNAGMTITYDYAGNEHNLLADTEQAADLLKQIGAIEDYTGSGEYVGVEVMMEDVHGNERLTACHWEQFISGFNLSQEDAIRIAATVEDQKQIEQWSGNMRSISSLIKRIGGGI